MKKILKSCFELFNNSLARLDDYINITGSTKFPLKLKLTDILFLLFCLLFYIPSGCEFFLILNQRKTYVILEKIMENLYIFFMVIRENF